MDEVTQLKKIINSLSDKLANANLQWSAAEAAVETLQEQVNELTAQLNQNDTEVHNITTKEN